MSTGYDAGVGRYDPHAYAASARYDVHAYATNATAASVPAAYLHGAGAALQGPPLAVGAGPTFAQRI
jgi:hypothetical protein